MAWDLLGILKTKDHVNKMKRNILIWSPPAQCLCCCHSEDNKDWMTGSRPGQTAESSVVMLWGKWKHITGTITRMLSEPGQIEILPTINITPSPPTWPLAACTGKYSEKERSILCPKNMFKIILVIEASQPPPPMSNVKIQIISPNGRHGLSNLSQAYKPKTRLFFTF